MNEIPVIAITGSKGKTTTKEMVASVLNQKWNVFKSFQNGNDPWFVEQYKNQINLSHEALVLEYGLQKYKPDNVKKCCEIIKPNIGMITNIGKEAIGCFDGQIEKIAIAKSELIKGMNSDGVLILNGDNDYSKLLDCNGFEGEIIYVGANNANVDYSAYNIKYIDVGMSFEVNINEVAHAFHIPIWGEYNVINALFAIAIANRLGLSIEQIKNGLMSFEKPPHRMSVHHVGGVTLIDDTFNASPEAMKVALDTLTHVGKGLNIAVLGSVAWLGSSSNEEHREIGKYLANKKIDYLYTFDDAHKPLGHAEEIGKAAIEFGFPEKNFFHSSTRKEFHKTLMERKISPSDTYLFKGANGLRLDFSFFYFKNYLQFCNNSLIKRSLIQERDLNESVIHRFEAIAKLDSSHIAIYSLDYQWSYKQLQDQVNRVTNAILKYQLKSKRIVILMKQDAPMIAAMLAVLKVDCLYVPLDVLLPKEKLCTIVEDINPDLFIVDRTTIELVQSLFCDIPILSEDELGNDSSECAILCTSQSNAYILYTSGTTGEPKGVLQNHANLLHYNRVYSNSLKITACDKVSLFVSFVYDSAVMDIYAALLNGATLYPFSLNEQNVLACLKIIKNNAITIYHRSPTIFRLLAQASLSPSDWATVRCVVLGGEVARQCDFLLYKKLFPDTCRFINGYGPTEATVSLQYILDKTNDIELETLPLGYPVDNTEVILINVQNDIGEIVIQCQHVAICYWNDENLSQQKFYVENGKRFYKTGDLGRRLENGTIEFIGRIDNQVKICGYKVVLTEVENILLRDQRIQDVVVLPEQFEKELILVAYYVANDVLSFQKIDHYLKSSYQWPALFVKVSSIPFTSNGKVDRKKLKLNHAESHILKDRISDNLLCQSD